MDHEGYRIDGVVAVDSSTHVRVVCLNDNVHRPDIGIGEASRLLTCDKVVRRYTLTQTPLLRHRD